MNSVSFGSTFKISHKNDIQKQSDVKEFCYDNGLDYSSKVECRPKGKMFVKPCTKINTTVFAPDEKDNLVETFLANKGIKFSKLNTDELLSKKRIYSRIDSPPVDFRLVKVDAKKLEKMMKHQDQNISHCEKNYEEYYKDDVDKMLKSGDKIPATSLHIIPMGDSVDDTVQYIKTFGPDRLNDCQLSFVFNQTTDEPDHCTYFGMKDLGIDNIPVYVDNPTYKVGKALDLFTK